MKNWNFLHKIRTIVLSRKNKKPQTEKWIEERTRICNACPFNTANMEKVSFKQKVIRFLSNTLTLTMTGKFNDSDSECSKCGCTLEFKVVEISEACLDNRWKSIYIPNSAQKKSYK